MTRCFWGLAASRGRIGENFHGAEARLLFWALDAALKRCSSTVVRGSECGATEVVASPVGRLPTLRGRVRGIPPFAQNAKDGAPSDRGGIDKTAGSLRLRSGAGSHLASARFEMTRVFWGLRGDGVVSAKISSG